MKMQCLRGATIFYLLLPSFLFLYGWLTLPFAIISILILAIYSLDIFYDAYRALPQWKASFKSKFKQIISSGFTYWIVLFCLLIAFWLAFSGVGGIGYQNEDYTSKNALLKDLIIHKWPLSFTVDNARANIVYYIGYYLPAAFVGKAFKPFGWLSANIFLFAWTLAGVLLAFAWFWNLSRIEVKNKVGKLAVLTAIFCLAGGLDYIGYYVWKRNVFQINTHIEFWAYYFQYSSNTTLLYWVPQHTLPSWLITGLMVDALYDKHNLKHLGIAVASGILWAPFGLVGVIPYLVLLLVVYFQRQYRSYLFNWKSILFNGLAVGLAAIYLLYLGSNQFKFPIGFIWQFEEKGKPWSTHLLAFILLEFAILGGLMLLLIVMGVLFSRAHQFRQRWNQRFDLLDKEFGIRPIQLCLFIISLCVLVVLPFFRMGFYNDLVMRGSIPSLFIFWAFVARFITGASLRVRIKYNYAYMAVIMIVLIGFFPSFAEIARSVKYYQFGPPPMEKVLTILAVEDTEFNLQRIGSEDTVFFRYLGK